MVLSISVCIIASSTDKDNLKSLLNDINFCDNIPYLAYNNTSVKFCDNVL